MNLTGSRTLMDEKFKMDKKILIGVVVILGITMFFAPGGKTSLFFLFVIALSAFLIIRFIKKALRENPLETDELDELAYSATVPVKTGAQSGNQSQGSHTTDPLSGTEQEIWELLTTDIGDILDVEDIKYEKFDPPIPLKWSTLNPFHHNKRNH